MGRKHKSRPSAAEDGIRTKRAAPREFDPRESKMKAINSWEDVADEVDDFHKQRDKILLEDEPVDDQDATSDEEVFALSGADDSSDEEEEDDEDEDGEDDDAQSSSDNDRASADPEDRLEGWGSSKKAYYGGTDNYADEEQDALDEEAEALRIQNKQLSAMSEADFLLDEDDWKDPTAAGSDDTTSISISNAGKAITEALPTVDPETLSAEDCLKLLKLRNPEFEPLSKEFVELQGLYEPLSFSAQAAEAVGDTKSITVAKFKALSVYLGVLGMYFAILTAGEDSNTSKVKEHGVVEGLVKCRQVWAQLKDLKSEDLSNGKQHRNNRRQKPKATKQSPEESDIDMESNSDEEATSRVTTKKQKKSKSTTPSEPQRKRTKLDPAHTALLAARSAALAKTESNLADLSSLIKTKPTTTTKIPTKISTKSILKPPAPSHTHAPTASDFHDPTHLTTTDTHDKLLRKKSLRFYSSQIISKSSKRSSAGRASGGDLDVPHRERNKDRAERLNAEAIKRGTREAPGDDLDDLDFGEGDRRTARELKNNAGAGTGVDKDLEYYNTIASATNARKAAKKEVHDAVRDAEKQGLAVSIVQGEVGPDGKRAIGYTIEKNKGLTPHRKKEVRNPRVKKRMKFEAAKKKLGSKKAVYKGLMGAYGGEATGIKTNLVKSVKLT